MSQTDGEAGYGEPAEQPLWKRIASVLALATVGVAVAVFAVAAIILVLALNLNLVIEINSQDSETQDHAKVPSETKAPVRETARKTGESEDAYTYLIRGTKKQESGDWEGAISDYTKAIELGPEDFISEQQHASAYHGRGDARVRLEDLEGAIEDYTKAIEFSPYAALYFARSEARYRFGDAAGSRKDLEKASERKGPYRNWVLDIEVRRKIKELGIQNTQAYVNRGKEKEQSGDFEGAIEDFTKALEAIESGPKHPYTAHQKASAYHRRGLAKAKLRDFEGAIADYTEAMELSPYMALYFARSDARYQLGDEEGARQDLETIGAKNEPYNRNRVREVEADG